MAEAGVDKHQLIQALQLQPHAEGGYFCRTYAAEQFDSTARRPCMTSIYYLLTDDSPVGHLHRNRSDIVHYWHCGSPLHYTLLSPSGELSEVVMGADIAAGQQLQLLVPGGYWKASRLHRGEYGLISEAVCPGFDFADHEMAEAEPLLTALPQFRTQLEPLIAARQTHE